MHLGQQMLIISPLYDENVLYYVNTIILITITITMSNKTLSIFNPVLSAIGPKRATPNADAGDHLVHGVPILPSLFQVDPANFIKQQWMQKSLYSELVSCKLFLKEYITDKYDI